MARYKEGELPPRSTPHWSEIMAKDQESLEELVKEEEGKGAAGKTTDDDKAATKEEAGKAGETEGGDDQDDDPLLITRTYDEMTGAKDSGRFKTDEDWFRHVREMEQTFRERDEDAKIGAKLRERLAGGDLDSLLTGGGTKKGEPPEFDPDWIVTDDEGRTRAARGAPKDVAERYDRYQKWATRRLHSFLTDPGAFLEPLLAEKLKGYEQSTQETKEQLEAQRQMSEISSICSQHRGLLYVDGNHENGMTPIGKKIQAGVERMAEKGADPVEALQTMIETVAGLAPPAKESRTKRSGQRSANIAKPAAPSDEELDKILRKQGGLAQIAEQMMRAEQAAAQ